MFIRMIHAPIQLKIIHTGFLLVKYLNASVSNLYGSI